MSAAPIPPVEWMPSPQKQQSVARPAGETNVDELGRAILPQHCFARDGGGRLFLFIGGGNKPTCRPVIRVHRRSLQTIWRPGYSAEGQGPDDWVGNPREVEFPKGN